MIDADIVVGCPTDGDVFGPWQAEAPAAILPERNELESSIAHPTLLDLGSTCLP
jgi:hypothetical protein